MSNDSPVLYKANGEPLTKTDPGEGRGLRIMTSSSSRLIYGRSDLKGAEPKGGDYRLYLDMYYKHPTVYSAINKIVKVCTNTGYDFVPRDSRSSANEREVKTAKKFFDQQRNFIGQLRRIYRDLLIFGDAYLYIVPDRKKRPYSLKRLPPWTMNIKAKSNGETQLYVQKDPLDPSGRMVTFQPHEILHFKIDDPGNDLYGLSPLESLKTTIATDLFALNFNKNFFKNGASMGTFIIVEDATDAELERVREWIATEYVGSDNAYKPVIVGGKGVKIERGIASHEEMAFLDGRNFIIEEILSVLDVPPAKIGRMETANRSNSKEQDKTFRAESVSPLQNSVENVINDGFMREILGLKDIIFDHSESDIRDAQDQMTLWKEAVQNGLLAINEVRNKMGYASVEGGNIPFIMTPTGAIPIDLLPEYFKFPQQNPVLPGGAKPDTNPPKAPPTTEVTGLKPSSKSYLATALLWMQKGDDTSLRSAYAYLADALEEDSIPLVQEAHKSLKKAVKTDDSDLRIAYTERATGFINQLMQEPSVE